MTAAPPLVPAQPKRDRYDVTCRILKVLEDSACGLMAATVANRTGMRKETVTTNLSRMYAYGVVDRLAVENDPMHRYRYSFKPKKPAIVLEPANA